MRNFSLKVQSCLRRRSNKWKMPLPVARFRSRILNVNRSVKIAVFLLASIVIFCYVIPHIIEFARLRNQHFFKTKNLDACISKKLEQHESAIEQFDAVAVHDALPAYHKTAVVSLGDGDGKVTQMPEAPMDAHNDVLLSSHFLAFVGNGQIGVHLRFPGTSSPGDLLVMAERTITLSASYNPLFRVELAGYARESSLLVQFRNGLLHEFSCFRRSDLCVSVERVAYVHRVYPSILVQEVHVANPTKHAVTVYLARSALSADLQLQELTQSALSKLVSSATEKRFEETRRVFYRDLVLRTPSDDVLPTRIFIETVVRSSNDVNVLIGVGDKLQLIAVAVLNADNSTDDQRPVELPVAAQSARVLVECTFVRTRTLPLKDANLQKVQAEVQFLQQDLQEDLLTLAPRHCRQQLSPIRKQTILRSDNAKRRKGHDKAAKESEDVSSDKDQLEAYSHLRSLHTLAWNAVYSNGSSFQISFSKAPSVLNPSRINATLFYLLGHVPMFSADATVSNSSSAEQQNLWLHPQTITWDAADDVLSRAAKFASPQAIGAPHTLDACYESRLSTFAAGAGSALWQPVFDLRSLFAVTDSWLVTLKKRSCTPLMRAGAFGLLQATILSFGPFRFVRSHSDAPERIRWNDQLHRHLELVADPKDLHRDLMRFGRLFFNEHLALTVSIELETGSYKPFLYIGAERVLSSADALLVDTESDEDQLASRLPAVKLFATDAELKNVMELEIAAGNTRTEEATKFALKYTEPATAVLYVAESRQHLEELRVATAVRDVHEFQAHPADVISLHREGHSFGGLPTAFWLLIATLIVVFHLFLIKLIYDEFCSRKRNASMSAEALASHGLWRFAGFRRHRNASSNSSDVFADEETAMANAVALKRLLVENTARSRQDSAE